MFIFDQPTNITNEGIILESKEVYTFEKQFRVWWKSPYVKFYCCSCYRKATQPATDKHIHFEYNGNVYLVESEPPEMDEEQQWNRELELDYNNHEEP